MLTNYKKCSSGINLGSNYDIFNYYTCPSCNKWSEYFNYNINEPIIDYYRRFENKKAILIRFPSSTYEKAIYINRSFIEGIISQGFRKNDIQEFWYCNNSLNIILTNCKTMKKIDKDLIITVNSYYSDDKHFSINPFIKPFYYRNKIIVSPNFNNNINFYSFKFNHLNSFLNYLTN